MTRRWMTLYQGEVAAAQYIGMAAHNVPQDHWEFMACCVCQQIDELHHSGRDRDMLRRAGIPQQEWDAEYDRCEARVVYEHLVSLGSPSGAAFNGGFGLE